LGVRLSPGTPKLLLLPVDINFTFITIYCVSTYFIEEITYDS